MNENSNRPTDVGRLLTGCDTKDLVKIRETELEELLALLHEPPWVLRRPVGLSHAAIAA